MPMAQKAQNPEMTGYRPEIDGLRAVAVLSVLFFHASFSFAEGGYVGVDVFFVISGFLITSILVREMKENSFSLLSFYQRRCRRILPALFLVLAACLPFAWGLLLPSEMERFAQSLMAVVFFSSNLFFWRTSGYFAPDASELPLLHTWSLGVEEQYYLFFPLLILFLWRWGKSRTVQSIFFLFLLSLAGSQWAAYNAQDANFFLMPMRAFELFAGALLAFVPQQKIAQSPSMLRESLAFVGLVAVLFWVFFFDDTYPFPSLYALLPVGGAVLVLAFGQGTMTGKLLSLRPVVGVGLISYSAYLWHQPVFVFARIASNGDLSVVDYWGLISLSLALSVLSWRFVEQPFRKRGMVSRQDVFRFSLVASLAALLVVVGILAMKGFPQRIPEESRYLLAYANDEENGNYVSRRSKEWQEQQKPFSEKGALRILIVGDSFGQDFINMLGENGYWSDRQIRFVYIPARCQLYSGKIEESGIAEKDRSLCRKEGNLAQFRKEFEGAQRVLLVFSWQEWAARALPQTIADLQLTPQQSLYVLGRKSFPKLDLRQAIKQDRTTLSRVRGTIKPEDLSINSIMKELLPSSIFIDQYQVVCGAGETTCPLFTPQGEPLSYDRKHLTPAGAAYIGKRLFEKTVLGTL